MGGSVGIQKENQFGDFAEEGGVSKFKLDNSKFGQTKFHQLAHPLKNRCLKLCF